MANNVDIAILKVRELQSHIFSNEASNNTLFQKTEELIQDLQKASAH